MAKKIKNTAVVNEVLSTFFFLIYLFIFISVSVIEIFSIEWLGNRIHNILACRLVCRR